MLDVGRALVAYEAVVDLCGHTGGTPALMAGSVVPGADAQEADDLLGCQRDPPVVTGGGAALKPAATSARTIRVPSTASASRPSDVKASTACAVVRAIG